MTEVHFVNEYCLQLYEIEIPEALHIKSVSGCDHNAETCQVIHLVQTQINIVVLNKIIKQLNELFPVANFQRYRKPNVP